MASRQQFLIGLHDTIGTPSEPLGFTDTIADILTSAGAPKSFCSRVGLSPRMLRHRLHSAEDVNEA